MSSISLKELLSYTVTKIKDTLGLESFTWGEYKEKLDNALEGSNTEGLTTEELTQFVEHGSNLDKILEIGGKDATTIGDYDVNPDDKAFFKGALSITTVHLPKVTSICDSAFSGCYNIVSVNVPMVTKISDYAFEYCFAIKQISDFQQPVSIGSYSFCSCTNLPSFRFLSDVESINEYAFYGCSNISTLDFCGELKDVDTTAFGECAGLKSVIIRAVNLSNTDFELHVFNSECRKTDSSPGYPYYYVNPYIYVPSKLVEAYNSSYTEEDGWPYGYFRAIEDYPEICGTSE